MGRTRFEGEIVYRSLVILLSLFCSCNNWNDNWNNKIMAKRGRPRKVPKRTPLNQLPKDQYGDVIFPPQDQQDIDRFTKYIEQGWDYQTSDPEDEVQREDFLNSYILYFKQKRDKLYQLLHKLINISK